jgi:hypothetical protein
MEADVRLCATSGQIKDKLKKFKTWMARVRGNIGTSERSRVDLCVTRSIPSLGHPRSVLRSAQDEGQATALLQVMRRMEHR